MNPFDAPPSTPPVSLESPTDPPAPRRGRMALVAVASTGLLAAGVIGVSALATADDPPLEPVDAADAADSLLAAAVDDDPGEREEPAPDENDGGDEGDDGGDDTDGNGDEPSLDGEIRIETGDGDPIVIDLGELGSLDGDAWERFRECADLPIWLDGDLGGELGDLDLTLGDALDDPELEAQFDELFGEFESMFDDFDLDVWLDGWLDDSGLLDGSILEQEPGSILGGPGVLADGGAVTVLGPDGVTIIDLGDGDGSVTITRDGDTGELTITTDGTATEQQLDDLFGELPEFDGEFEFPEFDGEFEFPALPGLEGLDPERIEDCLSELG
jgi:hypothetical protein